MIIRGQSLGLPPFFKRGERGGLNFKIAAAVSSQEVSMAKIILETGEVHPFVGEDHRILTVSDISMFFGSPVVPILLGNFWAFAIFDGLQRKMPKNIKASELMGIPVYGPVILADDSELPQSFLVPNEFKISVNKVKAQKAAEQKKQQELVPAGEVDEDEEPTSYKGKPIKEYYDYFKLVYDYDVRHRMDEYLEGVVNIVPKEDFNEVVDDTIEFFSMTEAYENCAIMLRLKEIGNHMYDINDVELLYE